MNNDERELWVHNDEGLFNWWKGESISMSQFIKENREDIDKHINISTGRIDVEKCLAREYYPASRIDI